ncbi:MAG TPA: hypothetical protein VD838_21220 [Anaeromyxobacteraceae bacterium]|nr:hypothetical protein [Anaeromyxobacteraceae bacterium]
MARAAKVLEERDRRAQVGSYLHNGVRHSHWNPHYYGRNGLSTETTRAIGHAFAFLVENVGERTHRQPDSEPLLERLNEHGRPTAKYDGLTDWGTVPGGELFATIMTPEAAAAFRALDQLILDALEEAYEAGKQAGSSLLGQMARGELSIADLSEAELVGPRPRRR